MERPKLTKEEFKFLTKLKPWRSVLSGIRIYLSIIVVIVSSIYVFEKYGAWSVLCIGFVIVAALQHALSIMLHETVHTLFFSHKKWNDLIGNIFFAYPIGFSLLYRDIHLSHHRYLGEEIDPDLHNYKDFPSSKSIFVKKIFLDFSGIGAFIQFVYLVSRKENNNSSHYHLVGVASAQLMILALFWYFGSAEMYLILWLLPLVTFTKGLTQLRNLAEHLCREEALKGYQRTRTFKSNVFERFFIAPLYFNYHAEHHWYPMIPYYNLPKAHYILQQNEAYFTFVDFSVSYVDTIRKAVNS